MVRYETEGHRGFCAEYPENTLISFRAAIEAGVDGIEFDVWLSKDKVPVIMHDGNAYRTTGVDGLLTQMTLAEIKRLDAGSKFSPAFKGAEVPALRELLTLTADLRPTLNLGVEIKGYTEETADITVAMLKEFGVFDWVCFYCFHARIVKYLRTVYGARVMGYPDFQMREFEADSYSYYTDIGISMAVMRSEVFPLMAAKNLPMHMYCADTPEEIALCLQNGARYVTGNDARVLARVARRDRGLSE